MITRRTEEGAVKCALRDFLLEEETTAENVSIRPESCEPVAETAIRHTGVDLGHFCRRERDWGCRVGVESGS